MNHTAAPAPHRLIPLLLSAVLALTGCTSAPSRVPLARESGSQFRTVTLLRPELPDRLQFGNARGMAIASMFGLAGELAAAPFLQAEAARKSATLASEVTETDLYHRQIPSILERRLTEAGLQVRVIDGPTRAPGEWAPDGALSDPSADAVLDVALLYFGFIREPRKGEILPCLIARARLTGRDPRVPLFSDGIVYGPDLRVEDGVTLRAPAAHVFPSFDQLLARRDIARDALEAGVRAVADHLALNLGPNRVRLQIGRVAHFGHHEVPLHVEIDGKPSGILSESRVLTVHADPGRRTVRVFAEPDLLFLGTRERLSADATIEARPGEDFSFVADLITRAFARPRLELRRVSREELGRAGGNPGRTR